MKYLLDTNIISEPLKKILDLKIMKFLEIEDGNYCICSPVLHELEFGIELLDNSKRKSLFKEYLKEVCTNLNILPYDVESARIHAIERARLSKLGKVLPFVDGQIASIASKNQLILITKNKKDYKIYKGLEILEI